MAVSKKTKASSTQQPSKKVSFAQEKRVKTFNKDKALLKRKVEEQEDTQVKKAKKSAIRQAKKPVEEQDLASSDEESQDVGADLVANDTELDALTEEQEEALRKEILGDLADDDDDEQDADSSDDEDKLEKDNDLIETNANVVTLNNKKTKDQTKAPTTAPSSTTGWIYVGRIPPAFTESDMKTYFTQFGDILHIRISRNSRGQSRHYGFIEFLAQDVAEIVAETMHNFLLDGRLLQCKVIPIEQRHPETFTQSKVYVSPKAHVVQARRVRNQTKGWDQYIDTARELVKNENKKRAALKKLNIDYDFPGYAASKDHWLPKMLLKAEEEKSQKN